VAAVTLFGYSSGGGFLHRRHPFLKLLVLGLLSGAVFGSGTDAVLTGMVFLLVLFPLSGVRFAFLRPAAGFLLLTALLLFGSLPLTAGLDPAAIARLCPQRAEEFLRLAFAVVLGILFTAVTSPGEIRTALSYLFRPLPRQISEPVLLLVTFVFTLLPLTFLVLEQTRQAQELRSAGHIRNPVKRMILLATPFLAHLFLKTDKMSEAAALRCGPDRFRPAPVPLTPGDFLLGTGTALLLRLLLL
jgi:energy-coupling factor transporter transmembrane protein EcfT